MVHHSQDYDPKNNNHLYILGQAWHVYAGNDITYSPRQGHIANILKEFFGSDMNENEFLAAGEKHWKRILFMYTCPDEFSEREE